MAFAVSLNESAPGLACFGDQRGIIARATREHPTLLDRLLNIVSRPDFHSVAAYMGLVQWGTTADDLRAVLDQEPLALLVSAVGEASSGTLYGETFQHLPDRFLAGHRYLQLAEVVRAGLGGQVAGCELHEIETVIDFWSDVVLMRDEFALALALACFPDIDLLRLYASALRQAREAGLLRQPYDALIGELTACFDHVDIHAFFYRAMLGTEAPTAPVDHPAFRQVVDPARLWKPPMPPWWRRRLMHFLAGTSVLLEYVGCCHAGDERPLVLLDQAAGLLTGCEIFGASAGQAAEIEALLPELAAGWRWLSLARVLGATLNEYAGQNDFHLRRRYHGVAK